MNEPLSEAEKTALKVVVGKLEAEAKKRVGARQAQEERWLEDSRAYHGEYDENVISEIKRTEGASTSYMNRTRRKTRAMAAKLKEMLFPVDDANWDIEPTPVPELAEGADQAARKALTARQAAIASSEATEDGQATPEAAEAATKAEERAEELAAIMEEAESRCHSMQREMSDALTECRYETAARRAIDNACRWGAGVIKGPVSSSSRRKGWVKTEDGFEMTRTDPKKPEFRWVDPWAFFPDGSASTLTESEGFFERHLLNEKGLRKLARMDGFDKDAIRELITSTTPDSAPNYMQALRAISGDQTVPKDLHHVWEYSGPLDHEDAKLMAQARADSEALEVIGEIDPLDEVNVVIWFCGTKLLKFGPYPLDSDEPLYSMFVLEPDEVSVWGKGVPRMMRESQKVGNAGWRAMLDNGGYAIGPHIVVDRRFMSPADGSMSMKGPKIWELAAEGSAAPPPGYQPFYQFQPTMNQEQLANIIAMSERHMDEDTGMTQLSTGEQSEMTTKTVGGMALLISQGGITFREIVRRFDDEFTVPNLRRCYDWIMQFSEKEEIKGDYEVKARGVSALLLKEMEAQNLLMVSSAYGADDPDIKADKLKKAVFRALMLDPDDYIRTPSERQKWLDEQQKSVTAEEVRMAEIEDKEADRNARIQMANMENARHKYVAEMNFKTAMIGLAEKKNMKMEELEASTERMMSQIDSKERIVAAEAAMSDKEKADARAEGRAPNGSGGYIA